MQTHRTTRLGLILSLLLASSEFARASGAPRISTRLPEASPEQQALELFNDGTSCREKADKLEKEAAAESETAKKEKLTGKARKQHESSIKKFIAATQKDPKLYQAYGSLGYAYRVTGDFTAALEAYDRALALESTYAPAIEYRAEAYLGLNRLEEVKAAYMKLFTSDRKRADELAAAIDRWVERRKSDPAGVAADKLQEFATWAEQRRQIASQTASVVSRDARW
ncbi:MAG: tetratricopeptide repeat protein [Thermoanaerobaculia bacterium]